MHPADNFLTEHSFYIFHFNWHLKYWSSETFFFLFLMEHHDLTSLLADNDRWCVTTPTMITTGDNPRLFSLGLTYTCLLLLCPSQKRTDHDCCNSQGEEELPIEEIRRDRNETLVRKFIFPTGRRKVPRPFALSSPFVDIRQSPRPAIFFFFAIFTSRTWSV